MHLSGSLLKFGFVVMDELSKFGFMQFSLLFHASVAAGPHLFKLGLDQG